MPSQNNDKKYFVYEHINKINGKIYIGVTCQAPHLRWGNNGCHYKDNEHFYRAMQKYGWNNFDHIILFENLSVESASKLEYELIQRYHSNRADYGYNHASGGIDSFTFNEDSKLKMRNAKLGRKLSQSTKSKISQANSGENAYWYQKHHSEESNQKNREKHLGKVTSEETKIKISEHNIGKHFMSDDAKKHLSKVKSGENAWNYGKHLSNEHKKKISESEKGKKHTQESIQKMKDVKSVNNPLNKKVVQIDKETKKIIKVWESISQAARFFNVSPTCISRCAKKEHKSSCGFIWEYLEKEEVAT